MSKKYERFTANAETWAIGGVLVVLAIAYVIAQVTGG
jgi:hypothetical protein